MVPSVRAPWEFASRIGVEFASALKDASRKNQVNLAQEGGVAVWPVEMHVLAFVFPNSRFVGAGASFGPTRSLPRLTGGRTVRSKLASGSGGSFSMPAHDFVVAPDGVIVVSFKDMLTSDLENIDDSLDDGFHGTLLQNAVGRFLEVMRDRIQWVSTEATGDQTTLEIASTPQPASIRFVVSASRLEALCGSLRSLLIGDHEGAKESDMYDSLCLLREGDDAFDARSVFREWNQEARDSTPELFQKKTTATTTILRGEADNAVAPRSFVGPGVARDPVRILAEAQADLEELKRSNESDEKKSDIAALERRIGVLKKQVARKEAAREEAARQQVAREEADSRKAAPRPKKAASTKPVPKLDDTMHRFFHQSTDGGFVECRLELHETTISNSGVNPASTANTNKQRVSNMRWQIVNDTSTSPMMRRGRALLAKTSIESGVLALVVVLLNTPSLFIEQATDLGLDLLCLEILVIFSNMPQSTNPWELSSVELSSDQKDFVDALKRRDPNDDAWLVDSPKESTLTPKRFSGQNKQRVLNMRWQIVNDTSTSPMIRRGRALLANASIESGVLALVVALLNTPSRFIEQATDLGLDLLCLEILVIFSKMPQSTNPWELSSVELSSDQKEFMDALKRREPNDDAWLVDSPKESTYVTITLTPKRFSGQNSYLTAGFDIFDEALVRALCRVAFGPNTAGIERYFPYTDDPSE